MDSEGLEYLHSYLLLHGHEEPLKGIALNDSIKSVMKEISDIPLETLFGGNVSFIQKEEMKKDAKEYMKHHFFLHPIGYLNNKTLKKLMKNRHIKTHMDIPYYYNISAQMINPFDLPIEYVQESIFAGSLCTQTLITDDKEWLDIILPELNVYFTHITLPKTITSIATTSYVHEITHTQLESQKGIIKDYYHAEALSIFMELMHTYDTSSTNHMIDLINRIENLLANFYSIFLYQNGQVDKIHDPNYSVCSYHRDIQYFYSIFIAFHLFSFYEESPAVIKAEMLTKIQRVFDGDYSFEEFLEMYSTNEENSINSQDVKKMIKKVKER